jgi:hypothetical protein
VVPPPDRIEGAPVVRYTIVPPRISPSGMTRHLVEGKFMAGVAALAICRSPGGDGFVLCYCTEDWNVLARSAHDSLDAALVQVELENDGVIPYWRSVGEETP